MSEENSIDTAGNTDVLRFVGFKLGEELFGQDINYIHEVTRIQDITDVPGSPPYILGVMNLRGQVIPLMDLGLRLGCPRTEITDETRVIVVEYLESTLGLVVDSVFHVVEFPASSISDPPESSLTDRNRHLAGIGQVEDNLIFFIDIEKIFEEECRGVMNIEDEAGMPI